MATLSLEYAIGYSGTLPNSLVKHPNGQDYVYVAGGCIGTHIHLLCFSDFSLVISPASAPQKQIFLTGHSDDITCLDVSRSVRLLHFAFVHTGRDGILPLDRKEKRVMSLFGITHRRK